LSLPVAGSCPATPDIGQLYTYVYTATVSLSARFYGAWPDAYVCL